MGSEGLSRRGVAGGRAHVMRHGIGVEIGDATHITVVGRQPLGATEIEDSVCFAIEAVQAGNVTGPIALIGHARRAKDPAVVEP